MYAVNNRREKENKMRDAIRKRNVAIREKRKKESVLISTEQKRQKTWYKSVLTSI